MAMTIVYICTQKPAGHGVHDDAAANANVPGGQKVQTPFLGAEPASHAAAAAK